MKKSSITLALMLTSMATGTIVGQTKVDTVVTHIMVEPRVEEFSPEEKYEPNDEKDEEIFKSVDEPPQFPGGEAALMQYVQDMIQYPPSAAKAGIEGRVVMQFVVEKDGTIGDIMLLRSDDSSLSHEAYRVCTMLPPFIPSRKDGCPVRVWYTLPIDFCLPDGDNAIRIGELTEDATQGDVIAQFNLGSRYYRGAGVPQDYAQAAHWLQLAAAQGHDEAGELLLMALALNKDYVAAAQCYQKAHHTDTVPDTGVMLYELARTLSYRDPRCVSLLTQATDHGNIQAMQDLTCLYAEVDGLERDEAKAVDFCSQYLRSSGMPCQGIAIADVYYHIATDITSDVISGYKRLEYLKASVELGHADAQMVLGKFYYNREDYAEALGLFEQGMQHGNVEAMHYLGTMYGGGYGVEQDWAKCIDLVGQAARAGNAAAQCYLGCCYAQGLGVPHDRDKAIEWLVKSANQGIGEATQQLLDLYQVGIGKRTVNQFRELAEAGDGKAQRIMGLCYYHGDGVKRDYDQAIEWLMKAADCYDDGIKSVARIDLARVYVRQQDFDSARAWLQCEGVDNATLMRYIAGKIYPDKDYLDLLQAAAREGNSDAQHDLACLYAIGKDVKRDDKKAVALYRQSLSDDVLALMGLQSRDEATIGDVYYSIGCAHDDIIARQRGTDARPWLDKAARAGKTLK